jgi:hypothetical protein
MLAIAFASIAHTANASPKGPSDTQSPSVDPLGRAGYAIAQLRAAQADCSLTRMMISLNNQLGKSAESDSYLQKLPDSKRKLEVAGAIAVKEAKAEASLVSAVKQYYLSALAVCDSDIPTNKLQENRIRELEEVEKNQEHALDLEMRVLGLNP